MKMHSGLILFGVTYSLSVTAVLALSGECTDLNGRTITPGLHYVPGPDTCTLCVCDSGSPKWCKAVLCSPPQDCKSFRVGNSCCEFICLDDKLPKTSSDGNGPEGGTDINLRFIVISVTVTLLIFLFIFLLHRLRQRKIRGLQNLHLSEDERSLGSIGYIAGSLAYLPGSMGYLGAGSQERHIEFHYEEPPAHYPLWKPPGNYFPRGEAPPPYEEAVAAARAEAALAAVVASSNSVLYSGGGNNSTLTNSGMGHRTIPINLATSGSFQVEPTVSTVGREQNSLEAAEPSRSRSADVVLESLPPVESRRSSRIMELPSPLPMTAEEEGTVAAIRSDAFYEDVLIGPPSSLSAVECFNPSVTAVPGKSKTCITTVNIPALEDPTTNTNSSLHSASILESTVAKDNDTARLSNHRLNDLNKGSLDSAACSCSYQCLPPPLPPDDNDDYRSECENCKSTHGSRYYLDQEPNITSPQETMTLHRRPQDYDTEEQGYYRTSLTLPTHTRRLRVTPLHGTPASSLHGARENWFNSMPASSTSSTSSEEE